MAAVLGFALLRIEQRVLPVLFRFRRGAALLEQVSQLLLRVAIMPRRQFAGSAIGGINRINAILGTSEHCIATHPSDMCVALAALEARVLATGKGGERSIAFADFHRLPGDTPQLDSNLRPDEIITAIQVPASKFAAHSTYLKFKERDSLDFALASVAAAVTLGPNKTVSEARLVLGGVAPIPWHVPRAEAALIGKTMSNEVLRSVAEIALDGAKPLEKNAYKVPLTQTLVRRALAKAGGVNA